ncbi:MAG TPA: hypothetical protein PKJ28_02975 [Bacteroidales bacterium]|nr:hypothetical protein [Bacteroidales bacterium]HPS72830.1 hypothetical protein [Bacteroidales bacterium]
MKTTANKFRIAAGLLVILPGILFSQKVNIPYEQKVKTHHEVPEDPYLAPPAVRMTSTPARYESSGFTMVQVNVDINQQNILGDAANEPSLTINPQNPDFIAMGWRQFDNVNSNFRQAGFGYSINGGQTWTFPGVIDEGTFRSDPVLDSDGEGNFYYNSLTSNNNIYTCKVFKSNNGGNSWDEGVNARGGDKQWMTIDRSGGLGDGNIYSSWTSYYSSCYPEFFTRSTDGGGFFENCLEIPGNPYWGTLTVGPDGELYVAGSGDWGGLVVAKSTTAQLQGSTPGWDFVTTVDLDGYITSQLPVNPVGLLGQANIDVDRSEGPGHGNVYVLASVSRYEGDPGDVMFAKSIDGGLTFDLPVRINDDESTSNYQWFGTMSVAPNGRIDAVWLDTREAGASVYNSALYYSHSEDQGETWSTNEKLSDIFDPSLGYPQQDKMGDYFDMESSNTSAHLAWANTLNGEEDVYYSVITPVFSDIPEGETDTRFSVTCNPNPVTNQATIRYQIPVASKVRLSLWSVYGKEILPLIDRNMPAGGYAVTLDASTLAAGYYLCRMEAGNTVRTIGVVKVN